VDAIAGVEAIISHIITQELQIPCAHAPAFSPMDVGMPVPFMLFIIAYEYIYLTHNVYPIR